MFDELSLSVHPMTDAFPMHTGDLADSFAVGIASDGVREPIVLSADGSMLLDGRNRLYAHLRCGRSFADIPQRRVNDDDDDGYNAFVARMNLRRDVTVAQRYAFGETYLALESANASQRRLSGLRNVGSSLPIGSNDEPAATGEAADIIAVRVGVSPRSFKRFLSVTRVSPELAARVVRGELAVSKAADMAKQLKPQLERARDEQPDADVSDLPSFELKAGSISDAEYAHGIERKAAHHAAENRQFDLAHSARIVRHCSRAVDDLREVTAEIVAVDATDSDLAAAKRALLTVAAELRRIGGLIDDALAAV